MNGLSLIIPFLNESDGMEACCRTLDKFVGTLRFPVELVFVDDGSTDGTGDIIRACRFEHAADTKLVTLSHNCGSHAAIRAGLLNTAYESCTWISADLQEPLNFIPRSYELLEQGYDAVYIERKALDKVGLSGLCSGLYGNLIRKYAVKNFSANGVNNIAFGKKVKDYLNSHIESNSSLMLQIMDAGFCTKSLLMEYGDRTSGQSKWTFAGKIKLFIDSFVAFSFMPLRLVSIAGLVLFLLGVVFGIVTLIVKLCHPAIAAGCAALACLMAVGFGITNISLGVIAEYLWRAYDAARGRPPFIVSDVEQIAGGTVER